MVGNSEKRPNRGDNEIQFTNAPIEVADLPQLTDAEFEKLDPNYLRLRLISDAIFAAVVFVATVVASFFMPVWIPWVVAVALLALTALAAWLHQLEVGHIGYLVREHDFSYRKGVISRSVSTVPYARVQHVSIDRGPLDRYLGLATLQLRTAGEDVSVPGMNHETASRLKALVVDRAGALADAELGDSTRPDIPGSDAGSDTAITSKGPTDRW